MSDIQHVDERPKRRLWVVVAVGVAWLAAFLVSVKIWG